MRRNSSLASNASNEYEDQIDNSMFLVHQNKALSQEMKRYKRQIAEAKKELELMRIKSREMESLVSVIQRSWSQLDIDASLLLDGLGDSEMVIENNERFKLLNIFLTAGTKHQRADPIRVIQAVPKLDLDEWSSNADIDAEKSKALDALEKAMKKHGSGIAEDGNMDVVNDAEEDDLDLGSQLEEHLLSHASFTLALLERLCIFIAESGAFERTPDVLNSLTQAKALHADRLRLQDQIQKLLSQIVDLEAKLNFFQQQKTRAERTVDRLQSEVSSLKAQVSSGGSGSNVNGNDIVGVEGVSQGGDSSSVGNMVGSAGGIHNRPTEVEAELREKLAILETQLAESEAAKSKVEMTLTERLARPLTQTEAQIADMRKSMEELRQQCKQRVASLITEGTELQEKVSNLELAIMMVEATCAARCQEIVTATQAELESLRKDRDAKQSELLTAQAELAITTQLRSQVDEYRALESSRKGEISRLQEKVKTFSASIEQLHNHLRISRENEAKLEAILIECRVVHADWTPPAAENSLSVDTSQPQSLSSSSAPEEDAANALTLSQARARARDLQQELDDVRAGMDDLILEIESVSSEERKVGEQCARLLTQMSDSQSMQSGVLEENLRLHDQVSDLQQRLNEASAKCDAVNSALAAQDAAIAHLRQSEHTLRSEAHAMRKAALEGNSKRHVEEQALLEAQQKLSLTVSTLEAAKKRNMELQARCDELGKKLEAERKLRMEAQRDAKKTKKEKEKEKEKADDSTAAASSSVTMSTEDVEMLEITLGMLRCSVCRDRFKEVAITRCFHLFCRHCIDENIRNRHRKCPACGEKFGQDDVKTIYFTH